MQLHGGEPKGSVILASARRPGKIPVGLLVLLVLVFSVAGGLGAWFTLARPKTPTAPDTAAVAPLTTQAQAEPGGTEAIDQTELTRLQKASLATPEPQASPDAPWTQWRGPNRDGVSAEKGIAADWDQSPPKVLWKHPVGDGYSSFAVAHGRLYTLDAKDKGKTERVLCLKADTGNEIWSFSYPSGAAIPPSDDPKDKGRPQGESEDSRVLHIGPKASPTFYDGLLYTLGAGGDFLCFKEETADGKPQIVWKHDIAKEFEGVTSGYGYASSPLVDGDLVVVQPGGKKGSVVAFNRRDGKLLWTALTDMNGYSSPVAATVAGIRQIICFTGPAAAGVRAADGAKLWYYPWGTEFGGNIATPVVVGDYVFISSGHGDGCALLRISPDGKGGCKVEPVYVKHNKLMRSHYSTCVFRDGYLYGFDVGLGNLKCIDLRAGVEKWADKRRPKGHLIYADGHLIIQTEGGSIMAVKATPEKMELEGTIRGLLDGGELWTLPAVANGRLYLRDRHDIICLDIRKPTLN
jgi:outer membrane protein assembly factor BamB